MTPLAPMLRDVWWLGLKELSSLWRDPVLVVLIAYTFTLAVYSVAAGANTEVRNAAVAIVDEDGSTLSRRLGDAVAPPWFQTPVPVAADAVDAVMDAGRYTFVLDAPPRFEADLLAGRNPTLQLSVDATAVTQAAVGAGYLTRIIDDEVEDLLRSRGAAGPPVDLIVRARFNPNLESARFTAVMQVINNITILGIVLVGAAVLREREHGTLEHLLAMPIRPVEIMLAKVWANGAVILLASLLSLQLVVRGVLAVPLAGSLAFLTLGLAVYLFAITALGIALTTLIRSMAQFGLLAIPVFVVMTLLSGSSTPLDSMPRWLQLAMQLSPSTHFVAFAQGVLYRGAGVAILWPQLLAMAGIGMALFAVALVRFRRALAEAG
jgi:ABC-2 type transport system permease protein